ncbi:MAG: BlaI/MecI/CopY family transcriptional regulator [Lachnospiraceae bacterium]|nr:BlaI/MecI/CopY family transcriptional regulator [Lachnospiraceae bacterium]
MITDFRLTKRERDILDILWASEDGMIASDFPKIMEGLTINTVQAVLKKLLKRELIVVKEIVYSGTVLSRKYAPAISEQDFTVASITKSIQDLKRFNITPAAFFAEILPEMEMSAEDLDMLQEFLEKRKS